MSTKVSVIIPSYKQPELLEIAIKSVMSQTYKDIELIVIEDTEGRGASWARNQGIKKSTGEYIALLDQDDMYLSTKLANSVGFLEIYSGAGMMHHKASIKNQRVIWHGGDGEWDIKYFLEHGPGKCQNLLWRNYICNSTPVIRRRVFEKVGLFNESLFVSADWDMWLRIEERFTIKYLDLILTMINSYPKDIPV